MKTDADRRAIIDKVRQQNEIEYGPGARRAVQALLSAGHPHPWTYVYELTQNALDAGARRVSWQIDDDAVVFQHDGRTALDEPHVRGLASLGASTKGLANVGFMGVGFKSVFARFRTARVSGFGFRFKFDVSSRPGALGNSITHWFDTLIPHWDDDLYDTDSGYTTTFRLERPVVSDRSIADDLARISSPEDPTPLAVLSLRGLKQVRVNDVRWDLSADGDAVSVSRHHGQNKSTWRWMSFVSRYRPDDAAMRQLLIVRQQTHEQVSDDGQRIRREVVGLVPIDRDGLPDPPQHGLVYATLPTQVQVPFGFHLQADWFVDIDRQNLRDIDNDAWQELIVRQVPEIVRQFLVWLATQSDPARKRGYRALCNPNNDYGILSKSFQALRDHLVHALSGEPVVPIHGVGARRFQTPDAVSRLPGPLRRDFGRHPHWRPDLLFCRDLIDDELLSTGATKFATWLGWGRDIDQDSVPWPDKLPQWWDALSEDTRMEALFALWGAIKDLNWNDAPVVPTEAGTWVRMAHIRWLNESAPTPSNPGGEVIEKALVDLIPCATERVSSKIRTRVERSDHEGVRWFGSQRQDLKLSSLVESVFSNSEGKNDLRLVSLLEWAMSRGSSRNDLVPWVLTEQGARRPADALLADPFVEGGVSRRRLFPDVPAIASDYARIDDSRAVRFLEQLGVGGGVRLVEIKNYVSRYSSEVVGAELDIDSRSVRDANDQGYTVFDYDFPFRLGSVVFDELQNWLSIEHSALRGKGNRVATSFFRYSFSTRGRAGTAAWVRSLQAHPWLLCTDGQRRKPAEVLLAPDPDYEDAPIAEIHSPLADRLKEEGVQFGSDVQESPAVRRLSRRGADDMSDGELAILLRDACEQVESGHATRQDLLKAINDVRVRGVPLTRVVQRTGSGSGVRSGLGDWIVALDDVEETLATAVSELPLSIHQTTTGKQALGFLRDTWTKKPEQVESIRSNLAAAYRYVVEDLEGDTMDTDEWHDGRQHAHVYGMGKWHALGPNLVVADIQSPLIRQLLPKDRIVVSSAHFGDGDSQVRRVARALGLGLLSEEVELSPGPRVEAPPCIDRLQVLIKVLSSLEDRSALRDIVFHEEILLQVGDTSHIINAYIFEDKLRLVGSPITFGAFAAEQIVGHYRLGQRGNVIPYLTAALINLDDDESFRYNLQILADELGLEIPQDSNEQPSIEEAGQADYEGPDAQVSGDEPAGHETAAEDEGADLPPDRPESQAGPRRDIAGPATGGGQSTSRSSPFLDRSDPDSSATGSRSSGAASRRRRAGDHFGLIVEHGRRDEHEPGTERSHGTQGARQDDHKARQAVVDYETRYGRTAREMPDENPGFDVESVDRSAGGSSEVIRRIEIKGVRGRFEGDASVVLSSRQFRDAIQHDDVGVEYWLYVVDSTETESPRVFPIPWTQYRASLRYGFYARVWAGAAEQPTGTNWSPDRDADHS